MKDQVLNKMLGLRGDRGDNQTMPALRDDFSDLVSAVHSIHSPSQKHFNLPKLIEDKIG